MDKNVIEKIEAIVGKDGYSIEPAVVYTYGFDASIFHNTPDMVVQPTSTEQVSEIMKVATEYKIPVTPRGSGTGLCGSAVPIQGGIVMAMQRMNKIRIISVEDLWVDVEAGCIYNDLNAELSKYGFFFPPSPGSAEACQVGGMVATNASGMRAVKYGATRDFVLGLTFVKADGEIVFSGVKTLEGRALTANDKFTFEIKEGEKTIATVTNDADGQIAYPTIEYTLADVGEHTYTVKETSENGNGITVDTNEYTVVVTVTDNGDGTLAIEATDNATTLNFTNTYEATGEIELEGTKTLVGRELAAGEFEFELIDEAGEVAATATNDAEGKITFTKLTYETADIGKTYTYTGGVLKTAKALPALKRTLDPVSYGFDFEKKTIA